MISILFIGRHIACHHKADSKMFPDTTKPIEILHYAYLDANIFPIDIPTEIAV